jgi:hypothetical protein
MKKSTKSALAVVAAAFIAATSSVVTAVIVRNPSTSSVVNNYRSAGNPTAAQIPTLSQCPAPTWVGAPLELTLNVTDADGLQMCNQQSEAVGRFSAQTWQTAVYNDSNENQPTEILSWQVPSQLEIVPGSVVFFNGDHLHGAPMITNTIARGLYTGSFSPHAPMYLSFMTIPRPGALAPCQSSSLQIIVELKGSSSSVSTTAAVHVSDPSRYCTTPSTS